MIPELELLREMIRRDMNDLADSVARGDCSDIESYRYVTGRIRGLAMAEVMLLEVDKKSDEDEE